MLNISLLGSLQVIFNEQPSARFVSEKARALFCYLVVTGQPHSRDALVGLFWGSDPEGKAKNSLRVALANLRKLFPNYFEATRQTVQFVSEIPHWLDIGEFDSRSLRLGGDLPAIDELQTVGALYRDEFLADFQVEGNPVFEEWLLSQRAYWREKASQLFSILAKQQIAAQAYEEGVITVRRLLLLEPWQESAHRQLMLVLSQLGEFNAALAQYETCRQLLADELGVPPMPDTIALYERIQLARAGRPFTLPAPTTQLVGRTEAVDQISQMLRKPACRLVTIAGIGGLGKTRLALAVGRQLNQEAGLLFLNGITFVPLQGVEAASSYRDAIATAVAQTLNLYLPGRRPPSAEVLDYLEPEDHLLIFDNFEHLQPGVGWLAELLQRCPNLKLLATSREPLNLAAEWRFAPSGLPFPSADRDGEPSSRPVEEFAAVQLFSQTAQQARPNFALTAENIPHVVELCQLVMGMPLAIKLAASWLRVMPTAQLTEELRRNLDILSTQQQDVPERQRTVRAVFDATWQTVTEEAQQALAGLSEFRGGFTAEAAQKLTAASPMILAELQDRGLLQFEAEQARYVLHELVRQYAAEKLAEVEDTAVHIRTAHTQLYAQQMAALLPQIHGPEPQAAFATLHQEIGNVRHAWQQAIEQLDLASLFDLMGSLFLFYERQGWFAEGQEQMATAVSAIQAANLNGKTAVRLLSGLLARQGALLGRIGHFTQADAKLHQSIDQARQAADPHLLTFALLEYGRLLRDQSRFDEASTAFQESLDIATELNDPLLLAFATEKVGVITWDLGSHLVAEEKLTEALTRFRKLQNTRQIANTLNSLGNVLMSAGNNKKALAHYEEALPILQKMEDWLLLDTVLINLGMVSENLGHHLQSRHYYENSLTICRRIGDKIGVAYCLTGIGIADLAEGSLETAKQYFEQSLALNRQMERERYVAINLNLLGDVAMQEEDWPATLAHFAESLAISKRIEHPWGVASSQQRLGDLAIAQGDETAASRHYLTALTLGKEMETPGFILTALTNLAKLLLRQGDGETAASILLTVQNQPALSDSLKQQVERLLEPVKGLANVNLGSLETAVATVQTIFRS